MRRLLVLIALLVPSAVAGQRAPLTLDRAIEIALDGSRDLRDAELGLEGARRQVKEAWGNVFPSVTMNALYTRNLSVPGTFMPRIFFDPNAGPDELTLVKFGSDNQWNFSMRAEQPLFRGAAFVGVGAASRFEALQREVVRGRSQQVITRVRVAYYDALLAEEGVRLTSNTVTRIRQTLEEMKKMERAGLASSYDVLRLEVELANVEPALRRARNGAAAARRSLAVELGLPQLDSVELEGNLMTMQPDSLSYLASGNGTGTVLDDAIEQALRQRTEIRQLELTEQLRRAELRAEQSEYLPQVSLFGTYSINAQQSGAPSFFGGSDAARAYGRQVGVQVSMPLFSGLQRPARVSQRQIAIRQVRTQRDLAEDQIENQVRTFVDQVDEARERAAAQRLGVEQARRGFQIATVQYREGLSSALELTDAESALRQSEFNYAEAVYDYLVARARLDEAMGNVDSTVRVARATPEVER